MFVPFTDRTALPAPGTTEGQFLEFKRKLNRLENGAKIDYAELAKDIAAFANAFGGTILLGGQERAAGELERFDALTAEEVNEAELAYVHAGEAQCFPRVAVDVVRLRADDGVVLAVNVEPKLDTVVGFRPSGIQYAYAFPVRRDKTTKFLNPEQIASNMLPQVRRTLMLLRQIPPESVVLLEPTVTHSGGLYPQIQRGNVADVDEETNSFRLGMSHYAIDRVESIYRQAAQWTVVYRFHGASNRIG